MTSSAPRVPPAFTRPLLLASTSPYRRALLSRLGVPFRAVPPAVDEAAFRTGDVAPDRLAAGLARRKAAAVAERFPDAVVIGSDQVCAAGGDVLGKPGDAAGARAQLALLAGRTHRLITAVAVAHPDGVVEFADETRLSMRALRADEIERYVAADDPTDCAGSYKLEARGIALFDRIESADHTAIVGLPLIALTGVLRELGYAIP